MRERDKIAAAICILKGFISKLLLAHKKGSNANKSCLLNQLSTQSSLSKQYPIVIIRCEVHVHNRIALYVL